MTMNNENIRNLRLKISELDDLETQIEKKECEINEICSTILETIYELQSRYINNNISFPVIVNSDHIAYECHICGDILIIRYAGDDLNRSIVRTLEIPMKYVDGEKTIEDWFNLKVENYERSRELQKKKKEDDEYQTYLNLKEKYEN